MKNSLYILFLFYILSNPILSNAQKLNTLDFKSTQEMYSFFRYAKGKKIISGHRGTVENNLPENTTAAMQAVLKHTTAIFEVDPRLTKDSIIVMVHDNTLDRTTNGKGKVSDYNWEELKKLNLKDNQGNITKYKIETLDEMIKWAKGKTILNLDKKDVPLEVIANVIAKHNAYAWVWVTVHNVEQAKFYLDKNPAQYLSMHIKDPKALESLKQSKLPLDRMIVYIGPLIKPENQDMYNYFDKNGVACMISSASSYDKLPTKEERAQKYRDIFNSGATILESDLPIEVSKAIKQN